MKKGELIEAVTSSETTPDDISKKAVDAIIDATFDEIKKAIEKDESFTLAGFGTFKKKKRAARDGRNPQTGETIMIPASTTVTFKPAKELKDFMGGEKS